MKKKNVLLGVAAGIVLLSGCMSFEDVKNKADAGDGYMAYRTGIMLKEGDGVKANHKQAMSYFEKAAKAGYTPRGIAMIDTEHYKMFGNRWDMASAWEVMNQTDIEKSQLFGDYYQMLWDNYWTYVVWPNPNRVRNIDTYERLAAEEKGCENGFAICLNYLMRLYIKGKNVEAEALKKRLISIIRKNPSWSQCDQNFVPRTLQDFLEKLERIERETEKKIAKAKRLSEEKKLAGQMRQFGKGIKLYKSIHSGLSVKNFLKLMNFPAMDCTGATRIGDDGTTYRISTFGSGFNIEFIAGFQGIIREYRISKNYLIEQAPPGFLFGIKYNFGGNVSAEALIDKVKKEYPDAKAVPDRKSITKCTWGRRNIDFDAVTVTKTWESERTRIIVHYCLIEFVGEEKTLSETQRRELENEITEGARWTNDQQRVKRMEAGMPLALNGKTMIIVDKELEQKMHEITQKAKQRDIAEKEAIRKKEEQKALDF